MSIVCVKNFLSFFSIYWYDFGVNVYFTTRKKIGGEKYENKKIFAFECVPNF